MSFPDFASERCSRQHAAERRARRCRHGTAVGAHDRAARELIRSWRGSEVARSDGFLVLFDGAADAVGFAWPTTTALRSIDPAAEGPRRPAYRPARCARTPMRTRHAAHHHSRSTALRCRRPPCDGSCAGRQTLLTAAAVQALGSDGTRASEPRPLAPQGAWRPLELFEVGERDALFEPPPDSAKAYRVVRTATSGLRRAGCPTTCRPSATCSSAAVEALHTLASLLDGRARLVTLLGIGGIGKTRLVARARPLLARRLSRRRLVLRSLDGARHRWHRLRGRPGARRAAPARPIRSCRSARPSPGAAPAWSFSTPSSKSRAMRRRRSACGSSTRRRPASSSPAARCWASRASRRRCWRRWRSDEARASSAARHGRADHASRTAGRGRGRHRAVGAAARRAAARHRAGRGRSRVMSPHMLLDRMDERFTLLASARRPSRSPEPRCAATLDWSWDLLAGGEVGAGPAAGVRGRLHARSGRGPHRVLRRRRRCSDGLAAVTCRQVFRSPGRRRSLRPAAERPGVWGAAPSVRGPLRG